MPSSWNFRPELCCLLGKQVAENPTQHMIEAAFEEHGLDWRYIQLEVEPEDLGAAVAGLRAMGFRGGNCTPPHEVTVIEHLDGLDESASLIGAVNCIVSRGKELIGENTEGQGFLEVLMEVTDPTDKHVVILGAGESGRAIAVELGLAGAGRIGIVNRTRERGEELVSLLEERVHVDAYQVEWDGEFAVPEGTDILVHTTSMGRPRDSEAGMPILAKTLRAGMLVADTIPHPPPAPLLQAAAAHGCLVIDGMAMRVAQARIDLQRWTGVDADAAVMKTALSEVYAD